MAACFLSSRAQWARAQTETPRRQLAASTRGTVLGVLVPQGFLDPKLIREFESAHSVRIKVDFLTSGAEIDTRLRANPFAWDLVVSDLGRLQRLQDSKLIQNFEAQLSEEHPRLRSSSKDLLVHGWSHHVAPLVLDSLGVLWNQDEVSLESPDLTFSWLLGKGLLSQLKGRLFFQGSRELAFLLGLLEDGQLGSRETLPKPSSLGAEELIRGQKWAKDFFQLRTPGEVSQAQSLTQKRSLYSVIWSSEYHRLKPLHPSLHFQIPPKKSLFEIHGGALTMESRHAKLATLLLEKWITEKRLFAVRSGTEVFENEMASEKSLNGRLISNLVPLPREMVLKYLSGPIFQ